MASDVDRIKERLGIVDVVSSYIKLEKAGMGYKARCPFHNEKTPSFHISPDRNLYYCFGCGAKGDIFTFIEEFEGTDFQGALTLLADKAGIEISGKTSGTKSERDNLYKIIEDATIFFSSNLSNNKVANNYLKDRGINTETIKDFRIGLAKDEWTNLYSYLSSKGYKDKEIEKAGLIKKSDKYESNDRKFYDRFRGRIIFPIADSTGRIIAFSGRSIIDNDKAAKYINSPETLLFNKSDTLYGYDRAKYHIKKANACILVEGQIDLVLAHQEGYPYTVAVSGTSFTGGHLNKIRRLTNNLIIAFDRDRAGVVSMSKTAKMALGMGMNVKVILLPEGKDPADLLKDNKEKWGQLVNTSSHVVEVFLTQISEKNKEQREYWKQVKNHILPLISAMSDKIDQAHFIDRVQSKTGIPEKSIHIELIKIEKESKKTDYVQDHNNHKHEVEIHISRLEAIERTLKAIVLWQESTKKKKIDINKLKEKIDSLFGEKQDYDISVTDLQELIFKIESIYKDKSKLKADIEELLLGLEKEILSDRISKITKSIKDSEENKEKEKSKQFLKQHQKLSEQLEAIKQKIKNKN